MIGQCRLCGENGKVEFHHINYKTDTTLPTCKKCHKNLHHNKDLPTTLLLFKPIDKSRQYINSNILGIKIKHPLKTEDELWRKIKSSAALSGNKINEELIMLIQRGLEKKE